jgi:hypothetical protein
MARRTLSREQRDDLRARIWHVLALVAALLVGSFAVALANAGWPQQAYWDLRMALLAEMLWPQPRLARQDRVPAANEISNDCANCPSGGTP